MAEYAHDPATGSWFFQAVVASSKLDRMTKNARAAHWNKARGVRYRETALITTQRISDEEQTHMTMLSGVRVIRGTTSPFPAIPGALALIYAASDMHRGLWVGDPQVMFPTGLGLPPFVRRPVVTCSMLAMQLLKDAPDPAVPSVAFDADYSFVSWFGGLELGAVNATTPTGIEYHIEQLDSDSNWPRAVVAAPINTTHTGQTGMNDTINGLRFRVLLGRVGGLFNFPFLAFDYGHPGAFYIHWQAMGPVAAY